MRRGSRGVASARGGGLLYLIAQKTMGYGRTGATLSDCSLCGKISATTKPFRICLASCWGSTKGKRYSSNNGTPLGDVARIKLCASLTVCGRRKAASRRAASRLQARHRLLFCPGKYMVRFALAGGLQSLWGCIYLYGIPPRTYRFPVLYLLSAHSGRHSTRTDAS